MACAAFDARWPSAEGFAAAKATFAQHGVAADAAPSLDLAHWLKAQGNEVYMQGVQVRLSLSLSLSMSRMFIVSFRCTRRCVGVPLFLCFEISLVYSLRSLSFGKPLPNNVLRSYEVQPRNRSHCRAYRVVCQC